MRPSITSYWWINEIAWSKHIYKSITWKKLLIDCGSSCTDGLNTVGNTTWIDVDNMPDVVIITHAHLDHIWDLPLLIKEWFSWKIIATKETIDLIPIALQDSLSLLKKRFSVTGKKTSQLKNELIHQLNYVLTYEDSIKNNIFNFDELHEERINQLCKWKKICSTEYALEFTEPEWILQKYTTNLNKYWIRNMNDISNMDGTEDLPWWTKELQLLKKYFQTSPYWKEIAICDWLSVTLYNAWHVLWSAQVKIDEEWYWCTIFWWDSWRIEDPWYLLTPHLFSLWDAVKNMIIEATYGWRQHILRAEEDMHIVSLIQKTIWPILYGNFALQRLPDEAQRLLYLQESYEGIPKIILDWVSAKKFMSYYLQFDNYNKLSLSLKENKRIAWAPKSIKAKLWLVKNKRVIVISPNGMMNWWPINDYMHEILSNPQWLLIIPWFQAPWTIGYTILNKKVYPYKWSYFPVKSAIYHCQSKSSHASANDLHTILTAAKPEHTLIVHWETSQKELLKRWIIENDISSQVTIPTEIWEEYVL